MVRIAMGIEYSGSKYFGWQTQKTKPSIQEKLEESLSMVADSQVHVTCAGRTDKGVHATQQVIHFDTLAVRKPDSWIMGCNCNLPYDIRVIWAKQVNNEFDARRSALARHYRYFIYNGSSRPAIMPENISWHYPKLQADIMNEAAQLWLGEHDFSSFRATECQSSSPIRKVIQTSVKRFGELIIFDIIANAFLHHMVRNMVGVLLAIGQGKLAVLDARSILLAKDRTKADITAAANGLYLISVNYPDKFEIPSGINEPWFIIRECK